MQATLIFPGITTCGWNCFGRINNSEANFIPYGLGYIAAYAKSKGHSVDALDLRKLSGWEEFEREIKKRSPGVYGISSMTVDFGVALEAMQRIKQTDKASTVILGGVHATVAPDDVIDIKEIDHIIKGEGEISFAELLTKLERGDKADRIITGIMPKIDTLPYPDRELFDFRNGELKMPWLSHMPAPFVSIIASRGCPYQCTFCQPAERAVFGGKARIRSVEGIIEELKHLRDRYDFKSLLIHDDLFAFNPKWVEKFCKAYRENGFDQIFTCQVRSDFIVKNSTVVENMAKSGLSCFMIGFESGSQRVLNFIKKGTTVEMNREAVELCKRYGIKIFANYMFGIPTETPEEVFKTVDFIRWAKPEYPSPSFFTPHPGSKLYDYCMEHDLSLIKSYRSYARNPTEPKIKGIDYPFLNLAIEKSAEYKIDEQIEYLNNIPLKDEKMKNIQTALVMKKEQLAAAWASYKEKYSPEQKGAQAISIEKKALSGNKEKKRVLVTGGTGFIGSTLVDNLLDKDYLVAVLTRNPAHPRARYLASKGAEIIQGHIEDQGVLNSLKGFNLIFHLAIFPGTSGDKMFEVNVGGTENILQAALKNETAKFIYASSIEAQGTAELGKTPLTEDSPCSPVSEYGRSKLLAEERVREFSKKHGLASVIARIGNVYGPGGLSFIYPMTEAILTENPLLTFLPLFKNRYVQPIYVEDLTRGFIASVEQEDVAGGTYNFTGNSPVLIGEWFEILCSFLGREKLIKRILEQDISGEDIPYVRALHPHIDYFLSGDEPIIHRVYSDERLHQKTGNYQYVNLLRGVAHTLDWYYRNRMLDNFFIKAS